MQPDGKVLVGENFTLFNGVARNGLVRLNADGVVDTSFDAATSIVNATAMQPDSKLIIGGAFGSVGGVLFPNLARIYSAPITFFSGQQYVGDGMYYLDFPTRRQFFGYYGYLADANYIYHQDLGYEYVFDAADGVGGVYFYDFASSTFFYTAPDFPFPYLYDFSLNSVLYYFPDPANPDRYNTNGVRYFYNFATGQIISK